MQVIGSFPRKGQGGQRWPGAHVRSGTDAPAASWKRWRPSRRSSGSPRSKRCVNRRHAVNRQDRQGPLVPATSEDCDAEPVRLRENHPVYGINSCKRQKCYLPDISHGIHSDDRRWRRKHPQRNRMYSRTRNRPGHTRSRWLLIRGLQLGSLACLIVAQMAVPSHKQRKSSHTE